MPRSSEAQIYLQGEAWMEKQLFTVAVPRTFTLSASTAFLIAVLLCPAAARAQESVNNAAGPALATTAAPAQAQEPPPVSGAPAVVPEQTMTLMAGTPIRVRLQEAVRTGKAKKGDPVRFLVAEEVRSADGRTLLVPAGATVEGIVKQSFGGGRFGQAGHIVVQGEHVLLPEGTRVPLRPDVKGSPTARGRGRGFAATGTGFLTGTAVGAGVLALIFTSGTTFSSDSGSGGLGLLSFVAVVGSGYLGASSIRGGEASLREGADYTFTVAEDTPFRTSAAVANKAVTPLSLADIDNTGPRWEWGASPLLTSGRSGRITGMGAAFSLRVRY
jgi:hypothetical protein